MQMFLHALTKIQNQKNYMKNKLYTDGVNKNLIDESMQNIDDYYACTKAGEKYLKNKTLDKKIYKN